MIETIRAGQAQAIRSGASDAARGRRVVQMAIIHPPLDTRVFYKQCRTLTSAGYEVHLITSPVEFSERDGVMLHGIDGLDPEPKPSSASRLWTWWRRLRAAHAAARDLDAQVYHIHEPQLIPIGLLLKLRGARVIYDAHEDYGEVARRTMLERPLKGWFRLLAYNVIEGGARRFFDATVVATPSIAKRFPGGGRSRVRTLLVGNYPVLGDSPEVHVEEYASRPRNIIYLGGISVVRGAQEMAQAMRRLPADLEAKLQLVGTFESDQLESEMVAVAPEGRLERFGWCAREEVKQLLASARVGLVLYHPVPNHTEAQPNKLFEYMEAGIPVVASNFPLWREIVEGNGCGLVVDPLDPDAIAQAIRWMLEHPQEAAEMGRRGQHAVQSVYNWNHEAAKLLQAYREVLA